LGHRERKTFEVETGEKPETQTPKGDKGKHDHGETLDSHRIAEGKTAGSRKTKTRKRTFLAVEPKGRDKGNEIQTSSSNKKTKARKKRKC